MTNDRSNSFALAIGLGTLGGLAIGIVTALKRNHPEVFSNPKYIIGIIVLAVIFTLAGGNE